MVFKSCWMAIIVATFVSKGVSKASLLTDCPIYWTAFGDNCYRFFGHRVNLEEARYSCRSHGGGSKFAYLASIHSQEENDYMATLFKSSTDSEAEDRHAWIGLNDDADEGTFVWTDGTRTNFIRWAYREPGGGRSQQGVVMVHPNNRDYGLWHNEATSDHYQYICKMPRS